jgi:6-phosphogluconate dehydrogenase
MRKDIVKDVPGAFKAWSRGTVVRSWLLDQMVGALERNPTQQDVSDYTVDSGEGKWTVEEAVALEVPMPVISASLFARYASRQQISPTMQAVAALRGEFGGHEVMTVDEGDALRRGDAPSSTAQQVAAKGIGQKADAERPHSAKPAAGPADQSVPQKD